MLGQPQSLRDDLLDRCALAISRARRSSPAGTPASLTLASRERKEHCRPADGKFVMKSCSPNWRPLPAPTDSSLVEVEVDDVGQCERRADPQSRHQRHRDDRYASHSPGRRQSDNIPTMTLGRGQTFVTWSSPQLAIRAGAPRIRNLQRSRSSRGEHFQSGRSTGQQRARQHADPTQGVLPLAPMHSHKTCLPQSFGNLARFRQKQQLDMFADVTLQAPTQLTFPGSWRRRVGRRRHRADRRLSSFAGDHASSQNRDNTWRDNRLPSTSISKTRAIDRCRI